jgi:hypothetical protein
VNKMMTVVVALSESVLGQRENNNALDRVLLFHFFGWDNLALTS